MVKIMITIILIILIVICTLIGLNKLLNNTSKLFNTENKNKSKVQHVSMDEIIQIMEKNQNYIILDVRTKDEFNDGHIPSAICIPNESIDSNIVNKLPDKEQLILIYCRSGNRSKQAAEKLEKLGYTNLIEFGGIIDWNGEIEK